MTTYNKENNTYTHDDGTTYTPSRGRKPAWVLEYIDLVKSKNEEPLIKSTETVKQESLKEVTMNEISKEKTKSIYDNEIYREFLRNLSFSKIHVNGKTINANAKDIMIRLSFTMTQRGIQAMSFNSDFNNIQKNYDGNLVMSAECFNRHVFDQNDIQSNNKVKDLKNLSIILRGGIKTVSKEKKEKAKKEGRKEEDCSLTKVINTSVVSKSYKEVGNDRLGFKAKDEVKEDENTNHLNSEINYLDTVFDVKMNISINQFIKNITGQDFAQKNALKVFTATDAECSDFIESCIPTKDNAINIDSIVTLVKSKIKDNMKHFSHRGISAEFAISDITMTYESI